AASKPRRPARHNAQLPCSSRGNAFKKGVRQLTQKNSAASGSGFATHAGHTRIRGISSRGKPQRRQSSGKNREKKARKVARTTEGPEFAIAARLLLEKTHLR